MATKKGKYTKELVDQICQLIESDDYSIGEICTIVSIDQWTYYDWKKRKPAFRKAIKEAERNRFNTFVSIARKGLLKRLEGETIEEKTELFTVTVTGKNKETGQPIYGLPKKVGEKRVKKVIRPCIAAIKMVLTNHDRDNFKEITNNEVSGLDGGPVDHKVTHVHSNVPLAENEEDVS